MKLEFEYPVLTTARVGRITKERSVVLLDKGDFVVPECSSVEIEQTVTWNDYGNERRVILIDGQWFQKLHNSYNLELGKHVPYYFDFQGMSSRGPRLLKPQGHLEHVISQKILRILRDNQGTVGSVLATDELIDTVAGDAAAAGLKRRGDEGFSKVSDGPFEDAKEQMEKAAENLMIIEGEFWQKCQIPMLWSGLGSFNTIRHDIFTNTYFENLENMIAGHWNKPSIISSIDGIEENEVFLRTFIETAGKEAGRHGRDADSLDLKFDDGGVATFDGPGFTLMHLAHLAISEAGETLTKRVMPVQKLNMMSFVFTENLAAYGTERLLDLQKTFSALRNAYITGEAGEELLECVRRIRADVLAQMDEQTISGYSRAVINEAICRWEDRPVSMARVNHGVKANPKL